MQTSTSAVSSSKLSEALLAGLLETAGDAVFRVTLGGTIRAFVLSSLADARADASQQTGMVVDLFLHGASRRGGKRAR